MNLSPITKIAIEPKLNYKTKRLRIAWKERENTIGYNLYISFSPNEPRKLNNTLIEENYTDVVLPEVPKRDFYVWVTALDEDNNETSFSEKASFWKVRNLEENKIMSYFDFDNDDNYFEDISQIYWPRSGTRIYNEIPDGDINGTNTQFSLRFAYRTGSLSIYQNGDRISPENFTELNGSQFEFDSAPDTSDTILCDYTVE